MYVTHYIDGPLLIGRSRELGALEAAFAQPSGKLVLVYGRRRIGKTYTLEAFSHEKPTLFYQATQQAEGIELQAFTRAAQAVVGSEYLPPGYIFPSWESALDFLSERNRHPRLIVVLDEFPYLVESTPALPSIIQRWWDKRGRQSSLMLILCGSAQTFMESLEAQAAPLHQRFTHRLHIGPISYREVPLFAPNASHTEHARMFAVLGGTPLYLSQWDGEASFEANLLSLFGSARSNLVDAAELVLTSDLPDSKVMFRIMQAIGLGYNRFSQIRDFGKVTSERGLARLVHLQLVERRVSANENPDRSKRSIYAIKDPYFRFFFRFISRNRGAIDRGLGERILQSQILPHFESYMGLVFEDMAREFVFDEIIRGRWQQADRVGSWWSSDGNHEIDVVGTSDITRVVLAGSVKWRETPLDKRVLANLEDDLHALNASPDVHKLLIGRGGMSETLRHHPHLEGLSIADLYAPRDQR